MEEFFTWKNLRYGAIALVVVFGLGTVGIGYKYIFGTANVEVDRQIFEHSRAFVQSSIRELRDYKIQWHAADGNRAGQVAIGRTALMLADQIRQSDLPEDIQLWVTTLRN